jgi:hypothetical protein
LDEFGLGRIQSANNYLAPVKFEKVNRKSLKSA